LLAACFTLHSINATLAIVPQRGAGLWIENRVLRRIFGPKRDAVTGDWRKLHNEELHNLYSSPITNRMIKSRRMK
jgi:hypothetical protein